MTFSKNRRQRFLGEALYARREEELDYVITDRLSDLSGIEKLAYKTKRSFSWTVAYSELERLILRYTAGKPVEELSGQIQRVVDAFDRFNAIEILPRSQTPPINEAGALEVTQLEAYVYILWLLSLCKLLDGEALIPKVISWIDKNAEYNRGRDTILEQIIGKLTGDTRDPGRYLLHVDAYRPMGLAILTNDPAERPALMKQFVENWYSHMKPCYWHGTHTDSGSSSYFGYWAFEAALVTVLWDIDDSSYRDHLVYPKDLVDWYRSHASVAPENTPPRQPAGQPCPKEGWWFTPAAAGSRRHFKQGEVMPEVQSDYGSTFWQWDSDQSAPKL